MSVPIITRPWARGEDKTLREGQVLFAFRDHTPAGSRRWTDIKMVTAGNVPMLNHKFDEVAKDLRAAGNVGANYKAALVEIQKKRFDASFVSGKKDDETFNEMHTVTSFMTHFRFLGVIRNEAVGNSRHQRMWNVDVRGRSKVLNLWGKVYTGDRLYLQLETAQRAKMNNVDRTDPYGNARVLTFVRSANDMATLMQLVPKKISLADPPLVSLDRNERTDLDLTRCFPIGVVVDPVHRVATDRMCQKSLRNANAMNELDMITIYVGMTN